jgi:hypothetical protein
MSVDNTAGAIDHEGPGYGKYPSSVGISFLKIKTGALRRVFGSIIHFKGKAELLGDRFESNCFSSKSATSALSPIPQAPGAPGRPQNLI